MITDTKVTIGTTESMPEEMEAQIGMDLIQGLVGKAEVINVGWSALPEEEAIKMLHDAHIPIPPPVPPNAKGPQVLHLNDKRGNRKAICRQYNITMKYLRKQIKLAKREGIDISNWGV